MQITVLRVTAIVLIGWILPIGGVTPKRSASAVFTRLGHHYINIVRLTSVAE